MRLQGKVIIVTGSTTGIGKAMAYRFVKEGAKVVIHGLEKDWGEEIIQELGKENAALCIGDLQEDATITALANCAIVSFGKLDGLVNNAAWVVSSNLETTSAPFFEKVVKINTIVPFLLIKECLPYLTKQKGAVLNIGSVNAYSGEPDLLAYSVSKGGLMTLTRNLGDTLHRENGVRVNQINPGWVLTETEQQRKMAHGLSENWFEKIPSIFAPSGRLIKPEEIAAAAVYWLGDECGPISGQIVELEQHPFIGRNPPKDSSTINN